MSVFHNNALIGAGGGTAAAADAAVATKSLRFEPTDTAHLSRTPSSAGNRRTWTVSLWLKRSKLGTNNQHVLETASSPEYSGLWFAQDDSLEFRGFNGSSYTYRLHTSQKFRDPSAWYHIVLNFDSTAATASDRLAMYVNGVEVTDFANTVYPSQNHDSNWNNTSTHYIATFVASTNYFGGYIADLYSIDGSILSPTSFGAFDSSGVWQAAAYSGTFGTNGFHLAFDDSSSNAALGTDSSGNDNTFTVNNLAAYTPGLSTADQGFGVLTYTGNATARNISGLSFAPDLVIIKSRSDSGFHHYWIDRVRGTGKNLFSNLTEGEQSADRLSSFNSDGIGLTDHAGVNKSGSNFVAWCWKAGGSASSNSNGTITSSVSASTTYGFSVVGYTGNNTSGATVGHGLSSAPKWIVVKSRDQNGQFWHVYHASLAANEYIYLNSNAAKTSGNDFMNGTRPTSSVFSLGNGNGCNKSSDNVIAYCWSEVSGFSKFSSFTGTGSSGNAVTTGFKPLFVLIKRTDTTGNWFIFDSKRGTGGTVWADLSDAEDSNYSITMTTDGFNVNGSAAGMNASGGTYIYAAFADVPNGADIDSLFDAPTNDTTNTDSGAGGEVSGNYATMNPLAAFSSPVVLSNGNLDVSTSGLSEDWTGAVATIAQESGKWYAEFNITAKHASNHINVGINPLNRQNTYLQGDSTSGHYYTSDGKFWNANSLGGSYASYDAGDVIGVAVDMDTNNDVKFYKNGSLQGTVSLNSNITTHGFQFAVAPYAQGGSTVTSLSCNFGQRAFAYSAPSGYKALNTASLPTPTIADGSAHFDTKLYTGNGTSQTISGLSFSPDWVWTKLRSAGFGHRVWDTVRGATKRLAPHDTGAEATESTALTAFTSDGFSVGSEANVNTTHLGGAFVAWCWDAGSSTVTNTSGSVNSSVRANPTAGFSIVAFTTTFDGNVTVGHGLGAVPEFIIVKRRTGSEHWYVHHTSLASDKMLKLESTGGVSNSDVGNSTLTNTLFNHAANTGDHIAYCFTSVAGYSAFGSYTGNASNNGPFVYTGFRVKWLMVKGSNYASNWNIVDATRNEFNETDLVLRANLSNAEVDGSAQGNFAMGFDFLSNGFKVRRSGVDVNKSGGTLIWAAFAENPFQANGGLAR